MTLKPPHTGCDARGTEDERHALDAEQGVRRISLRMPLPAQRASLLQHPPASMGHCLTARFAGYRSPGKGDQPYRQRLLLGSQERHSSACPRHCRTSLTRLSLVRSTPPLTPQVFCPALTDGSIGDMLFFMTYRNPGLIIDIVGDIRLINDLAMKVRPPSKTGMIVLGGGVCKHHVANANLMRNGADFAVYLNTAQARAPFVPVERARCSLPLLVPPHF